MIIASIERISNISSIKEYDNLDLLSILNYKVFTKKGLFSEDTLCIFIRCNTKIDNTTVNPINNFLINSKIISNKILPYDIYDNCTVLPLSIYPYEPSIGLDISNFF